MRKTVLLILLFALLPFLCNGQDIELYEQFNGRYDFTFVGNTLNENPNGPNPNNGNEFYPCTVLTTSNANLNLNAGNIIEHAYLYWSGSGTGDFNVKLNGQDITAERTFATNYTRNDIIISGGVIIDTVFNVQRHFFGGFADVTELVQNAGNGTYTLSDLDISEVISADGDSVDEYGNIYCRVAVNYAGWGIIVVYRNDNLSMNQLNIYDGFEIVNDQNAISLTLDNLNVVDNLGSKIGFLAWEGDANIAVAETLKINEITLSNTINPPNNAFNCTNTVTGSDELWNMDMDIYEAENYVNIGDTGANVSLQSGQDLIIMNAIVTKLNNQLPDATITIDEVIKNCDSREITVQYTVYNINSTDILPAGTPISIYADDQFTDYAETIDDIAIGGSETGTVNITIPTNIPAGFELTFVVDDSGDGTGIVQEIDENNNDAAVAVQLLLSSELLQPDDITACDEGFGTAVFDFSHYADELQNNPGDEISFHITQQDADENTDRIYNTSAFTNTQNPQRIFVRLDNGSCHVTTSFLLYTKKCPPTTYNYVTPNGDGYNDTFFVEGLRDIFLDFKMSIYNRWGNLVWTGDNSTADWDGIANVDKVGSEDTSVPNATYYFVLELNDPDFPEPIVGWVHVTK